MDKATYLAVDLGLRGADACYVAVASHLHLPLATFDKEQKKKAEIILPSVITPGRNEE